MTNSCLIQTSPLRNLLAIGASTVAAFPKLYGSYQWAQNVRNREVLIPTLTDSDPEVQTVIRDHLKRHGYDNAETLAIKTCESVAGDRFHMQSVLDTCLVISADYEAEIKDALASSSDEDRQRLLGNFRAILDHEMFHMQDQHAKRSIAMQRYIPMLTETAFLPLTWKLLKTKNIFIFLAGLATSIPLKRLIYEHVLNAHSRYQEHKADTWMIRKNDIDDLDSVMRYRTYVIRSAFTTFYMNYIEDGYSPSTIFNIIMKLFAPFKKDDFNVQRYDTDQVYAQQINEKMIKFYEKLERQPFMWPLRLLQYPFDPKHPFVLDSVQQISNHIEELKS